MSILTPSVVVHDLGLDLDAGLTGRRSRRRRRQRAGSRARPCRQPWQWDLVNNDVADSNLVPATTAAHDGVHADLSLGTEPRSPATRCASGLSRSAPACEHARHAEFREEEVYGVRRVRGHADGVEERRGPGLRGQPGHRHAVRSSGGTDFRQPSAGSASVLGGRRDRRTAPAARPPRSSSRWSWRPSSSRSPSWPWPSWRPSSRQRSSWRRPSPSPAWPSCGRPSSWPGPRRPSRPRSRPPSRPPQGPGPAPPRPTGRPRRPPPRTRWARWPCGRHDDAGGPARRSGRPARAAARRPRRRPPAPGAATGSVTVTTASSAAFGEPAGADTLRVARRRVRPLGAASSSGTATTGAGAASAAGATSGASATGAATTGSSTATGSDSAASSDVEPAGSVRPAPHGGPGEHVLRPSAHPREPTRAGSPGAANGRHGKPRPRPGGAAVQLLVRLELLLDEHGRGDLDGHLGLALDRLRLFPRSRACARARGRAARRHHGRASCACRRLRPRSAAPCARSRHGRCSGRRSPRRTPASPWPTRLRVICTRPSEVTSATWCFDQVRMPGTPGGAAAPGPGWTPGPCR